MVTFNRPQCFKRRGPHVRRSCHNNLYRYRQREWLHRYVDRHCNRQSFYGFGCGSPIGNQHRRKHNPDSIGYIVKRNSDLRLGSHVDAE